MRKVFVYGVTILALGGVCSSSNVFAQDEEYGSSDLNFFLENGRILKSVFEVPNSDFSYVGLIKQNEEKTSVLIDGEVSVKRVLSGRTFFSFKRENNEFLEKKAGYEKGNRLLGADLKNRVEVRKNVDDVGSYLTYSEVSFDEGKLPFKSVFSFGSSNGRVYQRKVGFSKSREFESFQVGLELILDSSQDLNPEGSNESYNYVTRKFDLKGKSLPVYLSVLEQRLNGEFNSSKIKAGYSYVKENFGVDVVFSENNFKDAQSVYSLSVPFKYDMGDFDVKLTCEVSSVDSNVDKRVFLGFSNNF